MSRRLRWSFLERWNQNLRTSAPSAAIMRSKRCTTPSAVSNSSMSILRSTRSMIGWVYQEPKKMPVLPLGGRRRQKRHIGGRSSSSSLGRPTACACTWRGSIHSVSLASTSLLLAPSTPATTMTTGNLAALSAWYCASSKFTRSSAARASYASLVTISPRSASSKDMLRADQNRARPSTSVAKEGISCSAGASIGHCPPLRLVPRQRACRRYSPHSERLPAIGPAQLQRTSTSWPRVCTWRASRVATTRMVTSKSSVAADARTTARRER